MLRYGENRTSQMPSNVPGTRLESKSNIILENTLLRVHRRRMQEIPCSVNRFWISMSHPGLSIHVSTSVDPEIEMETVSFQGQRRSNNLDVDHVLKPTDL